MTFAAAVLVCSTLHVVAASHLHASILTSISALQSRCCDAGVSICQVAVHASASHSPCAAAQFTDAHRTRDGLKKCLCGAANCRGVTL